jgi:hypothetical protein
VVGSVAGIVEGASLGDLEATVESKRVSRSRCTISFNDEQHLAIRFCLRV